MTKAQKRLPNIFFAPDGDEFPACLIGARIELPDEPHCYIWVFEFKAVYYNGPSGWRIWRIDGFNCHQAEEAEKALRKRAFIEKIKDIWIYHITKPPTKEMYDFIVEKNEELKNGRERENEPSEIERDENAGVCCCGTTGV